MLSRISKFAWPIIGIVFIISSLTKALDIHAFSSKIEEYMSSLGISLPGVLSDIAAYSIISIELILGIFFLNRFYCYATYITACLVIAFFTLLTLTVAIQGKIEECGCFGNILNLPPKMTLLKNLSLCVILIAAYPQAKRGGYTNRNKSSYYLVSVASFMIFSAINQPVLDSNYYTKGSTLIINQNIRGSEDIEFKPDNPEELKCIGIIRSFESSNAENIRQLIALLPSNRSRPIIVTSSTPHKVAKYDTKNAIIGYADKTTVSKLISANAGIVKLHDNTISDKWQSNYLRLQYHLFENKYSHKIILGFQYVTWLWIMIVVFVSIKESIRTVYAEKREKSRRLIILN